MPLDSPNDSAGNPITVGATVKLVGTVTKLNLLDPHYADVEVLLSHPISNTLYTDPPMGTVDYGDSDALPGPTQTYGGSMSNAVPNLSLKSPGPRKVINVHASLLTIGA